MRIGSIGRLLGGLLGFGLICSACGGSASNNSAGNATSCTPGSKRCDGHDIKRCDDSGTRELVWESCSSAECRVQGGEPSCAKATCAAGLGICNGTLATQCKPDGSGPVEGGVDCSADDRFCVAGQCRDTPCVAGAKSCKDGDVYLCAADGRSLSLSQTCGSNEVCSNELGACAGRICEPNQGACVGNRTTTCNALGSGFLPAGTDCAAQGKICVDGNCQAAGCPASSLFCHDNSVYECDAQGIRGKLSKKCYDGMEHCEATAGGLYAFCVANDCVAGQKVCAGDTIKTCNAAGQLPDDGTRCAEGEYCENAQCKARGCTLGIAFCKDNDVYDCKFDGPALHFQCVDGSICRALVADADPNLKPNEDLAVCVPPPCPPNEMRCMQNKLGTCATDGASLGTVATDCAASNQVCTLAGTCEASTIDTLAQDDNELALTGSPFVGDVLEVSSARKLTVIQMWLELTYQADVRWVVFEEVDREFVVRRETTTTAGIGSGFVSSGQFNYQLEAGKRYVLGAVVPEGGIPHTTLQAPLLNWPVSFGQVLGAAIGDVGSSTSLPIASSFSAYTAVYMKVTTEAAN